MRDVPTGVFVELLWRAGQRGELWRVRQLSRPARDLGRHGGGAEIPVVRLSYPREERVWRRDSTRGRSALRRGHGEGAQVATPRALDLRHRPGTQPRGVGRHWPGTGAAGLPAAG